MTHVVAVTSVLERDKIIKQIRSNLISTTLDTPEIEIIQDKVNRIMVYHVSGNVRVCIKQILIIIIPMTFDLTPLEGIFDSQIRYDFHIVYKKLDHIKELIKAQEKITTNRRESNAEYSRLVAGLSRIYE